jgi:hypothetical protein
MQVYGCVCMYSAVIQMNACNVILVLELNIDFVQTNLGKTYTFLMNVMQC